MGAPTETWEQDQWQAWLAERPARVREVAERWPPWHTYTLTTTGQLCMILQYDEHPDQSVTVSIVAWRDWLPFPRNVFGINPEHLTLVEGAVT